MTRRLQTRVVSTARVACTLAGLLLAMQLGCAGARHGSTTSAYQGQLLTATSGPGAERLEIESEYDPTLRTYLGDEGKPDYIFVESRNRVALVYIDRDEVAVFTRRFSSASQVGLLKPIPDGFLEHVTQSDRARLVARRSEGEIEEAGIGVPDEAGPWRWDLETDELVHIPSTIAFPAQVRGWTRGPPTVFDDFGRDVSIAYSRPDSDESIQATVYVVMGVALTGREYFDGSAQVIAASHRDVEIVSTGEMVMVMPDGHVVHGFQGVFRFVLNGTPVRSELWVFKRSETVIKFRISFPVAVADKMAKYVGRLVTEFDWHAVQ